MSETTGASNFPESAQRIERSPPVRGEVRFESELIQLPQNLRSERTAARLKGVISRIERDNSGEVQRIIIRTPRGDVAVKPPREGAQSLREGQNVEVEIHASRQTTQNTTPEAPRQVTIKIQPPVQTSPQAQTPTQTQTPTQNQSQSSSQTSVRIDIGQPRTEGADGIVNAAILRAALQTGQVAQISQSTNPPVLPQLTAGQIVRMNAVPSGAIQTFMAGIAHPSAALPVMQATMNYTGNYTAGYAAPLSGANPALDVPLASPTPPPAPVQTGEAGVPSIAAALFVAPENILSSPLSQISGADAAHIATALSMARLVAAQHVSVSPAHAGTIGAINTDSDGKFLPAVFDARVERIISPLVASEDGSSPSFSSFLQDKAQARLSSDAALFKVAETRAGNILATVIGSSPENNLVLSVFFARTAGGQIFTVQAPAGSLPAGTQVELRPLSYTPVTQDAFMQATSSLSIFAMPSASWPLLSDIAQTLSMLAPQSAQAFSSLVPQAGNPAQMPPAAMLFLSMMRGGDISGWMGNKTIDVLRAGGKTSLLSRLTGEGGMLSRLGLDVAGEWRSMMLPMMWQNDFHKIALHVKQDSADGDKDKNGQGKQVRFIFDLSLPNMGDVQLDGLYRPNAQGGKRLDLIVRTAQGFSQMMQMDMRRTYTMAIGQSGVTGDLSFQNDMAKWVSIDVKDEGFGAEA